ncbi:MAG: Gfo/Idh/MocA family oxidoreductase [Leptospira sp.]|nr:Gfo/Idh/MocA family oxidoreductase [Leptospira sp.]
MSLRALNFAIVGCGRIAIRHSELLGGSQIQNAKLIAVCDISIDRAKLLGEKFNVPYFEIMEDMLEKHPEIDVVSILTPSGLHAEHALRIAKYKKHIVVEKPMALTLDDADNMIRSSDENGTKLFVVKQNRFNVPVQKLKQTIENGRFGKLVLGTIRVRWCRTQEYYDQDSWRGTWEFDGGVITNQASHHIDLLEWLMGDVESVFAKGRTALVNIETEDTVVATVKFKDGSLGIIEATTAARPKDLEGSVSILGENGSVIIGGFAVNELQVWNFKDELEEDKTIYEKFSVNPPNVYGFGHKAYYEHVIDCILNNTSALVDGLEGRKSLELITALYESIETGKEVYLRFKPEKCKLGQR